MPLNVDEAAQALGCARATVTRLCRNGRLRAYNVGTGVRERWRIEEAEVERFKSDRGTAPPQRPRARAYACRY